MVQLRAGMGAGGGGGGYQSLDYGFRQNPSTGRCHLTPPTIPMGCGRKILEEVHIQLATFAGLMLLQTLIGLAASSLGGYSFYFWLEKEVIVIPENEVSNLIILEPSSSTSVDTPKYGYGYMGVGSGNPYLGPPPDFGDGYIPPTFGGAAGSSGPSTNMGGSSGSGSRSRSNSNRNSGSLPPGYLPGGGSGSKSRSGSKKSQAPGSGSGQGGASGSMPVAPASTQVSKPEGIQAAAASSTKGRLVAKVTFKAPLHFCMLTSHL